ncbi:MAG: putative metal-binding motif-containing protein [Parvularculaceae bacterium]
MFGFAALAMLAFALGVGVVIGAPATPGPAPAIVPPSSSRPPPPVSRPRDNCAEAEVDCDGDGVASIESGGIDCDDNDRLRRPGAPEVADPNDRDEDCNPFTYGTLDRDADGYTDSQACNWDPERRSWLCGLDCNDAVWSQSPHQREQCNGVDDNCDGLVDEGVRRLFFADIDGDGFGDLNAGVQACFQPDATSVSGRDCNDADPLTHPGQFEIANSLDDNCNGAVDEAPVVRFN